MSSKNPSQSPPSKKSQTSSTSKAPAKEKAPDTPDAMAALVERMEGLLAPALEFHNAAEEHDDDDVRFFYDVRIIRGKSTLFGRVTGTSTMVGLISESQLHLSAEKVDTEMLSKVVAPVANKFQELINRQALALSAGEEAHFEPSAFPTGLPLGHRDDDMSVEAEIISQQGAPKA